MIGFRGVVLWSLPLVVLLTACDSTHSHYVSGAAIMEACKLGTERSPAVSRLLTGHYVVPGRGLVLLNRRANRGPILSADTDTYEKTTIQLDDPEIGGPILVAGPGVKMFYTRGSMAFARKASGFYSTSAEGTIVIKGKTARSLTAVLDLVIIAAKSPFSEAEPMKVKMKDERTFTRIQFDNLTPWLGTCQAELGKEVHP